MTVQTSVSGVEMIPVEIPFSASDPEGQSVTLLAKAGADADLFIISSTGSGSSLTGFARLFNADYEWPLDANRDNVYELTLRVVNNRTTTTRDIRVNIQNAVDQVSVTRLATGFDEPVDIAIGPNNYVTGGSVGIVAERKGRLWVIEDNGRVVRPTPLLDISSEISTQDGMGILGIEFLTTGSWGRDHENGNIFVYLTNLQGDVELRTYMIRLGYVSAEPVPEPNFRVMRIDMPDGTTGNRGGGLHRVIRGGLLVGVGDGGGVGDPSGFAQNPNSLLGKLLRIEPFSDCFPADPIRNYCFVPNNPFLGNGLGAPEVWAMGLRNPTQIARDTVAEDYYVVDQGELATYEVNRLPQYPAGLVNFGWPRRNGAAAYNGGLDSPAFTPPIAVFLPGGASQKRMAGGIVYRGTTEAHQAEYIFGDSATGAVNAFHVRDAPTGSTLTAINNITSELIPDVGRIDGPVAITEAVNRDMLILDRDGEIFLYKKR